MSSLEFPGTFPGTFNSVPITISNTFFQYASHQGNVYRTRTSNMTNKTILTFFFHPLVTRSLAKGLPNLLFISYTFSETLSLYNNFGTQHSYVLLLNDFLHPL